MRLTASLFALAWATTAAKEQDDGAPLTLPDAPDLGDAAPLLNYYSTCDASNVLISVAGCQKLQDYEKLDRWAASIKAGANNTGASASRWYFFQAVDATPQACPDLASYQLASEAFLSTRPALIGHVVRFTQNGNWTIEVFDSDDEDGGLTYSAETLDEAMHEWSLSDFLSDSYCENALPMEFLDITGKSGCLCCPDGVDECKCPPGQAFDAAAQCVSTELVHIQPAKPCEEEDGTCCADGATWNGNTCACEDGAVWNCNTKTCSCPNGAKWDFNTKTCLCPDGAEWNGNACTCNDGGVWNAATKACACADGAVWDFNIRSCTCGNGAEWNGNACVCADGATWNSETGECKCAGGAIWDFNLLNCTCLHGETWDCNTRSCKCEGGPCLSTTTPPPTPPTTSTPTPTTVTPVPTTATPPTTCPPGSISDGSKCVVSNPNCISFDYDWNVLSQNPGNPQPTMLDNNGATCVFSKSILLPVQLHINSTSALRQGDQFGDLIHVTCSLALAEQNATFNVIPTEIVNLESADQPDIYSGQVAMELVRAPTTAKNTEAKLSCEFTFASQVYASCSISKVFSDCTAPELTPSECHGASCDQCKHGDCVGDNALPGPYEACDGSVYATVSNASTYETVAKTVEGKCCSGCGYTLSCSAMPQLSTVKYCTPQDEAVTPTPTTPAPTAPAPTTPAPTAPAPDTAVIRMAMDSVGITKNGKLKWTATSVAVGSALVALVALVVVKHRANVAATTIMSDEIAYSLLE